jgi:uncharacterized protein YkwD
MTDGFDPRKGAGPRVAFLLVALLAAAVTAAAQPATDETDCFRAADVPELLRRVNLARAAPRRCGAREWPAAHALDWNEVLAVTARGQALDMAASDRVSHDARDGRTLPQRLREADYRYSHAAENVAGGQKTIAAVIEAWLASPSHCAALMGREFRDVGLACVRRTPSEHKTHWVMHLGTIRRLE